MRFPLNAPVKIVMLGAGGTGAYVAPHIYRLLYDLDRSNRFIICDGDLVEMKNLRRQNFAPADLGLNKAQVLAERYASIWGMEASYVSSYIEDEGSLTRLVSPEYRGTNPDGTGLMTREQVLLLGCVDNNRTRQLCHEVFRKAADLIYIDSGNDRNSGQIVCGVRRKGHTFFRSVGGAHPEMLRDKDRFPSQISCAEAAQEDPQTIAANITAATVIANMVYNILVHGENIAKETDFSTVSLRMQTVFEKPSHFRRSAA